MALPTTRLALTDVNGMTPMTFYAHSTPCPDRSDWQSLAEHLFGTGQGAAQRASVFGGESLAQAIGLGHDLGKYTDQFQRRLEGEAPRVDHATWGAHVLRDLYGPLGTLMAYAIAGHHAGLANGRPGEEGLSRSTLQERLSPGYLATLPPLLPVWQQEVELPPKVGLPTGFTQHPNPRQRVFQLSLLVRMIFSCLVDADYVDTDNFYRRVRGEPPREEGDGPALSVLRERLDVYLAHKPSSGGINMERARILAHVRGMASDTPGLFSLTVPTGGGKTLASLAFALDHALAHGLRRVIYVIPFTSIIEQNAQVFREAFGDLGEDAVLEHHSAFFDDPGSEPQAIEKVHQAMENWDRPVIVTTAVQFFESLFAHRPSRCRKLHNIAGSVVILDEAQTLPLNLLRPCVAVLEELSRNYRTSVVLCTATQPAITRIQGFQEGLDDVRELAPEPPELYRRLRRVRVRHAGTLDDTALIHHLRERDQVLCIVNNRRHARALFEAIVDEPGAFHLTTLMYARHRSQMLEQVRSRLQAGDPCRLISTSLIEAGVDVSFPAVLRAEAGLDSIAQAAGRCNRNKEWPVEKSEVLVFSSPDWMPPRELEGLATAFREIQRKHHDDLLALEAIEDYFQHLYWLRGQDRLDAKNLLGLLAGSSPDSLPLETLAAKFRIIESAMRPVIVPYHPETGQEDPFITDALRDLTYAPAVARKLQPFLVQVPERGYAALWQAGAIQAVAPERYGEQFVRLVNPRLYDAQFGLHWDEPGFLSAEGLVW
ncbi:MAG: CRISPR-associated helicase Cas3' [Pigmentiphaga sp.]